MIIDSFTTLFFILAFIIPGFIFNSVYRKFVPVRYQEKEATFLNFVTVSCVNYGVWSWLLFWVYQSKFYELYPLKTGLIWLLLIFISPVLLGIAWGIISMNQMVERIFGKVGINTIHPIPTSWDYKFSSTHEPKWVLVTLKDKSLVAGLWGNASFASSDQQERDIYIQKVYKISPKSSWEATPDNNDGIWISGEQIRSIEFFKN
ncbi:MAG: DUF6338 family protein [Chloroflexota bacterium]